MASILPKIDIYGSKFHFRVSKENKSISHLGGFMTILTLCILGLFLYLFGHDFFYRTNPKVIRSGYLPSNYSLINLTEEKIIIPWRIEDISSIPVDPTGILYPKIYYYTSTRDPNTSEFRYIHTEYLNYYKCNVTDININNEDLKVGSYYCIDLTNKPIGGYWDSEFVYYFEIQLYFCPDGKTVDDGINCTDIEILKKYLDNDSPWYFTIYYPTHKFQPENYETPVKIHYSVHFTPINLLSRKNDRLYFQEIQMIDDKGYLFESQKLSHFWIAENLVQENVNHPEEKLYEKGHSSKLYTMNIYVSMEKLLYTRIYDKLYDVLAVVGGFSQIVIMIFRVFCEYYNMIKMKTGLLNSNFMFNKNELFTKPSYIKKYSSKITKSVQENHLPISNFSFKSNSNIIPPHQSQFNSNELKSKHKKSQSCKNLKSIMEESKFRIVTKNYFFYQFHKVKCMTFFLKGTFHEHSHFILAHKYINTLIDINSYLSLYKEILIMKHFLLNSNQLLALSNLNRYYLFKNMDMQILRSTIGYYNKETTNDCVRSTTREIFGKDFTKFLFQFVDINKIAKHKQFYSKEFDFSNDNQIGICNYNDNQYMSLSGKNKTNPKRHSFIVDINKTNAIIDNCLNIESSIIHNSSITKTEPNFNLKE